MVIVSFMETHATFTQSADRELRVWFFDVGQVTLPLLNSKR